MNPHRPTQWKIEVILRAYIPIWKSWVVESPTNSPIVAPEKYLFAPEVVNTPLFNALKEEKEENDDTN